ncbi:MAG: hypothetical protein ACK5P5_01385 [Pseudobdellovibrionaceae bacterium]
MMTNYGSSTSIEKVREKIDLDRLFRSLDQTGKYEQGEQTGQCAHWTQVLVKSTSTLNVLEMTLTNTSCPSLFFGTIPGETVTCQIAINNPSNMPQYDLGLGIDPPLLPSLK